MVTACRAGDTHVVTRDQWFTVAVVRAINVWIFVASVVTVAALLAIHIWINVANVVTVAAVLAIHVWIHVERC